MASVQNKPPISEETLGGLSPEVQELIRRIIDHYERRIAELEARLNQTPLNSSLPPSTQHPHAKPKSTRTPSGKKRGGQPGHPKHERPLIHTDACQHIEVLKPQQCQRCGKPLAGDDPQPLRHQVWELPKIEPLVTEYQVHRLPCVSCGATTGAPLPAGVPTGQSGPRLVAFVALLMAYFRQSKRRTALFVETILHIPCSVGLTVKHQHLTTEALTPCLNELHTALPNVAAANLDETATKQAQQKAWIWVAVTSLFTLFAVRLTRAACVVHDLLGETFDGIITCDRYTAYEGYRRQFCWAHLKRDFQAMMDAGEESQAVGQRLMEVTRELFSYWHRYRKGTLQHTTMVRTIRPLKVTVWEALEDGMRCPHAPTAGTCRHLFERFDHLWTFLDHADVEPTNNAAERALRHAVIWRKLSFGTQSISGSRFMETLLSVIATCRQQDRDALAFITAALEAHFAHHPPPFLLTRV